MGIGQIFASVIQFVCMNNFMLIYVLVFMHFTVCLLKQFRTLIIKYDPKGPQELTNS